MKRAFSFLLAAALLLCLASLPVLAAGALPRAVDEAGLLSDDELAQLNDYYDALSERLALDVALLTVRSLDGKTPTAYADDYYDENGFGVGSDKDGVLLLVYMADPREGRGVWISTCGYGITALTDYGIDALIDTFIDDLADGAYYDAFTTFGRAVEYLVNEAREGHVYDVPAAQPAYTYETRTRGLMPGSMFVACVVIGVLLGWTTTSGRARRETKTVRSRADAGQYLRGGNLDLFDSRDVFLTSSVSRTPIRDESSRGGSGGGSSTHFSSSGVSHGGGGRKF